jgi:hypothetical protein
VMAVMMVVVVVVVAVAVAVAAKREVVANRVSRRCRRPSPLSCRVSGAAH